MNALKAKASSVKNHVNRNRGKYGLALGLTTGLALQHRSARVWNEFLDEKGLTQEFYAPAE